MTKILQLKIALRGIKPTIWRRFLVKDEINFQELHDTIQDVMGWEDYHLFEFQIDKMRISADEEGHNLAENSLKSLYESPEFLKMLKQTRMKNGSASLDINKINKILKEQQKNKELSRYTLKSKINSLINTEKQKIFYVYDFGDGWKHTLTLEKVLDIVDAITPIPTCLAGERACPPEDCGSVYGYDKLIEIKKDKKHPEYGKRIVEWLGKSLVLKNLILMNPTKSFID